MSLDAPTDAFEALAEPRRREIVRLLASGEPWAVGDLVTQLRLPQPSVSKHLIVLRAAGIVSRTKDGQRRLYRLEPEALKPVYDWIKLFERFWDRQLLSIKERAERKAAQQSLQRQAAERKPKPPEPEK